MSENEQFQIPLSKVSAHFKLLKEARKLPKKILNDASANHELIPIAKHTLAVSPLIVLNNMLRVTLPAWYQEIDLPNAKWPSLVAYILILILASHQELKTIKATRRSMSAESTGLHLLAPALQSVIVTRGIGLLKSLALVTGVVALKETNTIGSEKEAQLLTTYFAMLCMWMLTADVGGNILLRQFLSPTSKDVQNKDIK